MQKHQDVANLKQQFFFRTQCDMDIMARWDEKRIKKCITYLWLKNINSFKLENEFRFN